MSLNYIENIKSKLKKWEEELKIELLKKSNREKDIYLINKEWLENYFKIISNKNYNENELIKFISNNRFFEKNFFKSKNINDFPKLFVLNKESFLTLFKNKNDEKPFKGKFFNKIFIIEIVIESNFKIYCFYFLDQLIQLRQGYLYFHILDKEEKIINDFKVDFIKTLKNYKNEQNSQSIINNKFFYISNEEFDLHIFEYEKNIINLFKTENKNFKEKNLKKEPKDSFKNRDEEPQDTPFINSNDDKKKEILRVNKINGIKVIFNNYRKIYQFQKNKEKKFELIQKNNTNKISKINEEENNAKVQQLRPKKIAKVRNKRAPSVRIKNINFGKKILKIDNDNLNLSENLPNKVIHKKSSPGIIGLQNIGATCYMNATLQCFSNIDRLRLALLNKDFYQDLEKNKKEKKKLSFALAEVLKNLWETLSHSFYAPEYFKQVISEMNPLFKGIAANDPKDLVLFLLETIHKELNNPPNNNINNNIIPDNRNLTEVLNNFFYFYTNKNSSIIFNEFYGFSNNSTECGFFV